MIDVQSISFLVAFVGGLLSIISPCILPILPAFFAYNFKERKEITKMTFSFFLGFTIIFILMGLVASFVGQMFEAYKELLILFAGIMLIVFAVMIFLGKGFSFIGRQYRITLGNRHYFVDLVFYHRILKCFVLIDLKINEVNHADIGQMNTYLNYFKSEECSEGDNSPIGIVLATEKEHIEIQYALGGLSNKLFVSKYQLYLPNKEELQKKLQNLLETKDK